MYDVKNSKKKDTNNISVQTATSTRNAHPFIDIDNYNPLSRFKFRLYSSLREAVPIIDASISKLVRLIGTFKIECDDELLTNKINNFLEDVKVGVCSSGIDSFLLLFLDQLLTYGTAVGEIVPNENFDSIEALYNTSLKNIELKCDQKSLELMVYKKTGGKLSLIENPEFVLVSSLNSEPDKIYGNSIMKGLPFVSGILLKIFTSTGNNWDRVGNARFAVTYKPPSDSGEKMYTKERVEQIATEWSKTMKSDVPSDFVSVGDVDIKVIGADNQILDSKVPVRQILEQIVSKLSIPPFLLGLSWTTTESMATQQLEVLNSELESYRRILNPIIRKICKIWMKFKGVKSDFKINWCSVNLKDDLRLANTRLLNARAEEIELKNQISKEKMNKS